MANIDLIAPWNNDSSDVGDHGKVQLIVNEGGSELTMAIPVSSSFTEPIPWPIQRL